MTAPNAIDAAPAPGASELSATAAPAPAVDGSEALYMCCAFALGGNPLAGMDTQRQFADAVLARVAAGYTRRQVFGWRQITFETEVDLRWRFARRLLRRLYPEVPGVDALPESSDDAELPEVVAACVT